MLSIGDKNGDWTVIAGPYKHAYLCKCTCGAERALSEEKFLKGKQGRFRECRHRLLKLRDVYRTIVPGSTERVRAQAKNAIIRCTDCNYKGYKDYGGRGIKICQEWLNDKTKFIEYLMILSNWDDESLELDRINNDGHYEPGNLRFVSKSTSQKNKRPPNGRVIIGTGQKRKRWRLPPKSI